MVRSVTYSGCHALIVGPRFKCTLCADYDLCAQCEADPAQSHQVEQGEEHLFLKIQRPLDRSTWQRSVLGGAPIQGADKVIHDPAPSGVAARHDQASQPAVETETLPTPSLSSQEAPPVEEAPLVEEAPPVEEAPQPGDAALDPPDAPLGQLVPSPFDDLPDDPFTGSGTPGFDFGAGLRAVSQLVGMARDVVSYTVLQDKAPALRYVAAILAALPLPRDHTDNDMAKLTQVVMHTLKTVLPDHTPAPTQEEVKDMIALSLAAPATDDPPDVDVTGAAGLDSTEQAPSSAATHPPSQAELQAVMADQFRRLLEASAV